MRILSPHCGLAPESTSGGEVYERELLTRMTQADHDILLARGKRYTPQDHWHVHEFPIARGLRWWVAPFVAPESIRARAPFNDLLRVHSLRYMGPAAIWARTGLPMVAHHHHLDDWRRIERWVVQRVQRVIVGSEFARRQMASAGFRTDHVTVIPYGVDTERFTPWPRHHSPKVVLTVGGLKARKGLHALLTEVWPVVYAATGARLVVAGDGPQRAALEALRVPGVEFHGYVTERDKPWLYRRADVYVSTSSMEGFGLAVAEAMASGLPVVALRRGSLPELVGSAGVLAHDLTDVGQQVKYLLQHAEMRRAYGQLARARMVERFTWDACVEATYAAYEQMVQQPQWAAA